MSQESLPERLEECFLAAADGQREALAKALALLAENPAETAGDRFQQAIKTGLQLVLPDPGAAGDDPPAGDLVLAVARLGVDNPALRDALIAVCRKRNRTWPDPGGLLRSLGVRDAELPITDVLRHWDCFCRLAGGVFVWHSSYGFGQVKDIDPFSDMIEVNFDRRRHFSLKQALASLVVLQADSPLAKLRAEVGKESLRRLAPDDFRAAAAASFIPVLTDLRSLAESLYIPGIYSKRQFDTWWAGAVPVEVKAAPVAEPGARAWHQARSLDELKLALNGQEDLAPAPEQVASLARLFQIAAPKPQFAAAFAEGLASLRSLSHNPEWVHQLARSLTGDVAIWRDAAAFGEVTAKFAARLAPHWFAVTLDAVGRDRLIAFTLALPRRFWNYAEGVFGDEGCLALEAAARASFQRGEAGADATLWLWQRQGDANRQVFENPQAVFRVLDVEVSGEFIKAHRDLQKLLLDDQDFQRVLMHGGSEEGIRNFVRLVKNDSRVLNKGERQSLLVKVVRVYPSAIDMVAERRQPQFRTNMPRLTSARTYEERRREFHRLINELIPANSAAIAHARGYGDLRENAEFKAAKENQRLLMTRRGELERDLREVQPTDFSEIEITTTAVPGSAIDLSENGQRVTYYLLGLWDSVPERQIISYDTPLGHELIGKSVGEEVTRPDGSVATITAINPLPPAIRAWVAVAHEA